MRGPNKITAADPDAAGLLTESQRRRLAPVNTLKRKRRSRKLRRIGEDADDKYVPLVPGARATTDETILAAFSGDTIQAKREQGEDYWVDPQLMREELDAEAQVAARRNQFKLREATFQESKLKEELVAPYKNNVIGAIVIGVGVIAVVFSQFPGLLENDLASSVASFPSDL